MNPFLGLLCFARTINETKIITFYHRFIYEIVWYSKVAILFYFFMSFPLLFFKNNNIQLVLVRSMFE